PLMLANHEWLCLRGAGLPPYIRGLQEFRTPPGQRTGRGPPNPARVTCARAQLQRQRQLRVRQQSMPKSAVYVSFWSGSPGGSGTMILFQSLANIAHMGFLS